MVAAEVTAKDFWQIFELSISSLRPGTRLPASSGLLFLDHGLDLLGLPQDQSNGRRLNQIPPDEPSRVRAWHVQGQQRTGLRSSSRYYLRAASRLLCNRHELRQLNQ